MAKTCEWCHAPKTTSPFVDENGQRCQLCADCAAELVAAGNELKPWQERVRVPVTGGKGKWPVFDRHGVRIHVGDRLRVQYCSGRYGQTRQELMTVENAHWDYCQEGNACTVFDFSANALRTMKTHHDFEHGHEAWAEIIGEAAPDAEHCTRCAMLLDYCECEHCTRCAELVDNCECTPAELGR